MNLLLPREVCKKFPLSVEQMRFVKSSRDQVRNILNGTDPRLLLVIGPCSVHDPEATIEYARKLADLSAVVSDSFYIVMRAYYEKPRTKHGWKGMLYDPHLDGSCDINVGIQKTRKLLSDLTDMELGLATELLDPSSFLFFGDYLSWGCVGARTSASQIHRQSASNAPIPIGFKNTTDGNIEVAIQGVVSAAKSHAYCGINDAGCLSIIRSSGNPDCHIVLRGSDQAENYDASSIRQALALLEEAELLPKVLVDCSHGNSKRVYHRQREVFEDVLNQILSGNHAIRGMILESNLSAGSQEIPKDLSHLKYGVSITDSCLDWESTKSLVLSARNLFSTADAFYQI